MIKNTAPSCTNPSSCTVFQKKKSCKMGYGTVIFKSRSTVNKYAHPKNGGKEQARLRVYSMYDTAFDIMATESASQRTRNINQSPNKCLVSAKF